MSVAPRGKDRVPAADPRTRRAMSQDDFALAEPGSGLSFTYDGLKVISVAPISVGTNGVTLTLGAANQTLAVNSAGNAWEYKTYTSPLTVGATTISIAGLTSVGTANQLVGTNAAASGWEYKAVTVTSAGAIAGATTITASGLISGGSVTSAGAIAGATTITASGLISGGSGQFGGATNYTTLSASGDIDFHGNARVNWAKKTAASVTLTTGTSAETVTALQTAHDGTFYNITEAVGAPGINLIVDFTSVVSFNWVQAVATYEGGHSVAVQLYNWITTTWDTFDACENGVVDITTAGGYILGNHSFWVPDDANYIGTAGDDGKVRVRFYHTGAGNPAHDLHVDVVALY